MRTLIAFFVGAVLAGTLVYYAANHERTVQLVPPQPVRQETLPAVEPPPPPPPAEVTAPAREPETQPVAKPQPKRKVKIFKLPAERTEVAEAVPEFSEPPLVNVASPPATSLPFATGELEDPLLPPEPHKVVLQAGTLLTVRLAEEVGTDKHAAGDAFAATLDQPLVIEGFVIAEKGSRAEGKVIAAEEAGRVKGTAGLQIQLTRFNTSDGQKIEITTDTFEKKTPSGKSADVAKIGAAAAIGAAIGAAVGGGKGAAIGGAVGGAASTGTILGTRGKQVTLPSETRLTFRLSAPVTITERL